MMLIYMIMMFKWGLLMEQGQVNGWLKVVGECVMKGDEVFDVEIDKILLGVECVFDGMLCWQVVQEGEMLLVGVLFGVVVVVDVSDVDIDVVIVDFQCDFVLSVVFDEVVGLQFEKVQIGGCMICFLKLGEGLGMLVVLIYGFGGDLNNWLFNYVEFVVYWLVWVFDLLGYGELGKVVENGSFDELVDVVFVLFDVQYIECVYLIGYLMGGVVVMMVVECVL